MRCARRCGDARRRRLHNGSKGFWVAPGQSEAGEPHRDTFEKRGPWSPLPKSGAERKVDERSVGYAIARRATPGGSIVATRSLQKGVTLNVAFPCRAFYGTRQLVADRLRGPFSSSRAEDDLR